MDKATTQDNTIEEIEDDDYFSIEATKSKYVFLPNHPFKIVWDFVCISFIIYQVLYVPIEVCFQIRQVGAMAVFEIFQDFFFPIDILVSFNTGIVKEGMLILSRKKIAINYLKGWFMVDLISSFPFSMIIEDDYFDIYVSDFNKLRAIFILRIIKLNRLIRLVRLIKIIKLKAVFRYFEELSDLKAVSLFIEFIKIIFKILIISHWLSCIWFMIGDIDEYSWLDIDNIRNRSFYDRYVAALYFVLITMITVGFGDFVPVNSNERIFVIVLQLFSGIIFSYIMGSIGALLQSIDNNPGEESIKRISMKQILLKRGINKDLLNRINKHLDYSFIQKNSSCYDAELFGMLSEKLKEEVSFALNKGLIDNINILSSNELFAKHLIKEIREESVFTKEIIYLEEEVSNKVYYLVSGSLIVFIQEIDVVVKSISSESSLKVFGQVEFFGGYDRLLSIESKELSKLSVFDIEAFRKSADNLKEAEPDEFVTFKEFINDTREKIRDRKFEALNVSCDLCGGKNHLADTCPSLIEENSIFKLKFRSNAFLGDSALKDKETQISMYLSNRVQRLCLPGILSNEYLLFNQGLPN